MQKNEMLRKLYRVDKSLAIEAAATLGKHISTTTATWNYVRKTSKDGTWEYLISDSETVLRKLVKQFGWRKAPVYRHQFSYITTNRKVSIDELRQEVGDLQPL